MPFGRIGAQIQEVDWVWAVGLLSDITDENAFVAESDNSVFEFHR